MSIKESYGNILRFSKLEKDKDIGDVFILMINI
jgi:hypothetical protein